MKLLEHKVIMITGAAKGIGRQTALTFAAHGARLILNGRDEEQLEQLKIEINDRYQTEVMLAPYDIRDYSAAKTTFVKIKKQFGHLHGLVNNAGILKDRLLGMIDDSVMTETFDINLKGIIIHMQYACRLMKGINGGGSIVNLSSIMGTKGAQGQVVYGASKAGIVGATLAAAKELAPRQIRVNAIAPGFIDTDMARKVTEEQYRERMSSIGMGRVGTPEDVAHVALFMCSDLSAYVTGQIIGVDGGMIL